MIIFINDIKYDNILILKEIIICKIIIISTFFLLLCLSSNYNNELSFINRIELKVLRYIKYKRKKNITKYYFEKDLPYIKEYVKSLRKGLFKEQIYNSSINNVKISFIATVYNKEKYINSFISSIQYQKLKEFELIFVDDCSTDNSFEIINNFTEKDKRIKLIKNEKNRGSLFSRYIGAIYAKGEYIIFIDSDDIILREGILNSYNYMKKKNIDMIEFNSVFERNNTHIYITRRYFKYSDIIKQPILSYIFYYKKNGGTELNTALWDKIIKREIVLESLNYIGTKYLNKRVIIENDVIILFALFQKSNSFQYIDELGYYYYFNNNDSITNTWIEPIKAKEVVYSIFYNIQFLYEHTKNTYFDKYFCIYKLQQGYNRYKTCFNYINKQSKLIKNILNQLLESNYISIKNKKIIKNIIKELKYDYYF